MKIKFVNKIVLLGFITIMSACSNSNNNNCPSTIQNSLGTYRSYTSAVDLNSGSGGNTNTINALVSNSNSCDKVEIQLTGGLSAIFTAKFNSYVPSQGAYFTIPIGASFSYSGIVFKVTSSGNFVFINENQMNFGIVAVDADGENYCNVTFQALK